MRIMTAITTEMLRAENEKSTTNMESAIGRIEAMLCPPASDDRRKIRFVLWDSILFGISLEVQKNGFTFLKKLG
jgi:hypothetical protein